MWSSLLKASIRIQIYPALRLLESDRRDFQSVLQAKPSVMIEKSTKSEALEPSLWRWTNQSKHLG